MYVNATEVPVTATTLSAERSNQENVAAALIIFLIVIVSFAGNGLVLISYAICSKLRSGPSNWLILNLAMSDMMSTVYIQIPAIVSLANPRWQLRNESCTVHAVFTWIILTASNWILASISLDRAIAMTRPFQYRNFVTTYRARVAMAITWIFSIILASSLVSQDNVAFNNWELMCTPRWTTDKKTRAFFAAILCFWIPASVVIASNLLVINAARRMRSVVTGSTPTETGQDFCVDDGSKTLRSLYVLVATYLLCACPYFLAKFSIEKDGESFFPKSMVVLSMITMFLASAANPFIYAILRRDMREACLKSLEILKDYVRRLICRNRMVVSRVNHHAPLARSVQPVSPQANVQPTRLGVDELSLRIFAIPGAV